MGAKYKKGDKFIIEIDSVMTNKNGTLYGIKGFKSLVFDDYGLEQLQKAFSEKPSDASVMLFEAGYAQGIKAITKAINESTEEWFAKYGQTH